MKLYHFKIFFSFILFFIHVIIATESNVEILITLTTQLKPDGEQYAITSIDTATNSFLLNNSSVKNEDVQFNGKLDSKLTDFEYTMVAQNNLQLKNAQVTDIAKLLQQTTLNSNNEDKKNLFIKKRMLYLYIKSDMANMLTSAQYFQSLLDTENQTKLYNAIMFHLAEFIQNIYVIDNQTEIDFICQQEWKFIEAFKKDCDQIYYNVQWVKNKNNFYIYNGICVLVFIFLGFWDADKLDLGIPVNIKNRCLLATGLVNVLAIGLVNGIFVLKNLTSHLWFAKCKYEKMYESIPDPSYYSCFW